MLVHLRMLVRLNIVRHFPLAQTAYRRFFQNPVLE